MILLELGILLRAESGLLYVPPFLSLPFIIILDTYKCNECDYRAGADFLVGSELMKTDGIYTFI